MHYNYYPVRMRKLVSLFIFPVIGRAVVIVSLKIIIYLEV
jgi:hypothetical protein